MCYNNKYSLLFFVAISNLKNIKHVKIHTRGKMPYTKLANEYINEAIALKNHILSLKKIYAKEIALNESDICERVAMLYDIYLELKCIGDILKIKSEGAKND